MLLRRKKKAFKFYIRHLPCVRRLTRPRVEFTFSYGQCLQSVYTFKRRLNFFLILGWFQSTLSKQKKIQSWVLNVILGFKRPCVLLPFPLIEELKEFSPINCSTLTSANQLARKYYFEWLMVRDDGTVLMNFNSNSIYCRGVLWRDVEKRYYQRDLRIILYFIWQTNLKDF